MANSLDFADDTESENRGMDPELCSSQAVSTNFAGGHSQMDARADSLSLDRSARDTIVSNMNVDTSTRNRSISLSSSK